MQYNADQTRRPGSLHLRAALLSERIPFVRTPAFARAWMVGQVEAAAEPSASPEDRYFYVRSVYIGWRALAVSCMFVMLLLAFLGDEIDGARGRRLAMAVPAGAAFFCVVGVFYACWRLVFAYLAKRRAMRYGVGDGLYQNLARRSILHNTSILGQSAAAALTLYLIVR